MRTQATTLRTSHASLYFLFIVALLSIIHVSLCAALPLRNNDNRRSSISSNSRPMIGNRSSLLQLNHRLSNNTTNTTGTPPSHVTTGGATSDELYYVYVNYITPEDVSARRVRLPKLLYRVTSKKTNLNVTTDTLGTKILDVPLKYKNGSETNVDLQIVTVRRDIILDYDTERYFFVIQLKEDKIVGDKTLYTYYPDESLDRELSKRKYTSNAIIITVIVLFSIFCLIVLLLLLFCAIKIVRATITPNFIDKLKEMRNESQVGVALSEASLTGSELEHDEADMSELDRVNVNCIFEG